MGMVSEATQERVKGGDEHGCTKKQLNKASVGMCGWVEQRHTFGKTNVMCILKDANGNYITKKGDDWLNDLIPYVENTATVRMPVYQ